MSGKSIWIVGRHAVTAVLNQHPERALELWYVNNARNPHLVDILRAAAEAGVSSRSVDKSTLAKKTSSSSHQGLALLARPRPEQNENQLIQAAAELISAGAPLFLVLDQVQDPHNFGACLRTADAAGADGVIVAKDRASPMTQVVQKVASGAAETVPVYRVTNLARALQSLQELGVWVVGTSDKADADIYATDLTGPLALVMGAEGPGLRSLTEKVCDQLIRLPMAGSLVSSLNVSVATGICLYEAVRQRQSGSTD